MMRWQPLDEERPESTRYQIEFLPVIATWARIGTNSEINLIYYLARGITISDDSILKIAVIVSYGE